MSSVSVPSRGRAGWRFALAAVAAGCRGGARRRADLPDPDRPPDRAVPGRRLERRDGAADRAASRKGARPDRRSSTTARPRPVRSAPRRWRKAAPDGHTLLLVASSHTVQPALNPKLPYNTEKDFAPISLVNTNAMFFFVNPSVPANTLTEFVELAKKEPGKYNYASPGVGSQTQLTIELLEPPHRHQARAHSLSRRRAGDAGDDLAARSHFTMLAPNVHLPAHRGRQDPRDRERRADAPSAAAERRRPPPSRACPTSRRSNGSAC